MLSRYRGERGWSGAEEMEAGRDAAAPRQRRCRRREQGAGAD